MRAVKLPWHRQAPGSGYHAGGWKPSIPSHGLTVDTPAGPVDLVVVDRILRGYPCDYSHADLSYIYDMLPYNSQNTGLERDDMNNVAECVGLSIATVKRAHQRRAAKLRQEGGGNDHRLQRPV